MRIISGLVSFIKIRVADPLYFDAAPDLAPDPWIRIKKYGSGSGSLDPYKKMDPAPDPAQDPAQDPTL